MTDQSFSTRFTVTQSPEAVFAAIQNVRGWWSQTVEGKTAELGDEFTYRYPKMHVSRQKLTEVIPGKKMVWKVLSATLSFVKDQHEWSDTEIIFDIAKKGAKTEVVFTHRGLVPAFECFDACSGAWGTYVTKSLKQLIETGTGEPDEKVVVASF
ncbi:MAG: SRPBCC domain-containing protein [Myxococcales bacterium]|nr:SRPBCC domain-containing protein [Myxococcales bacterium]